MNECTAKQVVRIGILGGSFQPIHNAHLNVARAAADALALDQLRFMIAGVPPHKQLAEGASSAQRLAMLRLAVKDEPRFVADDRELYREGKSYTADTLQQLKTEYPDAELYFLMGSDMLRTFLQWYAPQRIAALATLVCIRRDGQAGGEEEAAAELERTLCTKVIFLDGVGVCSSHEIRGRVREALPLNGLVPPAVQSYIYENLLYQPEKIVSFAEKLKASLSPERYAHSLRTMATAIELAQRWGVDGQQARLAGLLHDCAKGLPTAELQRLADDGCGVPAVLHAPAGAILAKRDYGVTDEAVLKAIRLHTTGDAGMSSLDKLIYLSDLIEPGRSYPTADKLRALSSPDEAILLALQENLCYIKRSGKQMHPATLRAYHDLGGNDGALR